MRWFWAKTNTIPTVADDDCNNAVMAAPRPAPARGDSVCTRAARNRGRACSGATASSRIHNPKKSNPM